MANTYQDLQTNCQLELYNRADLSTQIKNAILAAINYYGQQKWWFNEEQATLTTTIGQAVYAWPSNWVYDDSLTIIFGVFPLPMIKRDWATMIRLLVGTSITQGLPTDYAYYADQLWLFPTPNQAYVMTNSFTQTLATLSAGTDANAWTAQCEELIRSRVVADVRCNILREQAALQELGALGQMPFMAKREMIAYNGLRAMTTRKMSARKIRPHYL